MEVSDDILEVKSLPLKLLCKITTYDNLSLHVPVFLLEMAWGFLCNFSNLSQEKRDIEILECRTLVNPA